jgi:hypothetical protein
VVSQHRANAFLLPRHGVESAEPRRAGGCFAGIPPKAKTPRQKGHFQFPSHGFNEARIGRTRFSANAMINMSDNQFPLPVARVVDRMQQPEQRHGISPAAHGQEELGASGKQTAAMQFLVETLNKSAWREHRRIVHARRASGNATAGLCVEIEGEVARLNNTSYHISPCAERRCDQK